MSFIDVKILVGSESGYSTLIMDLNDRKSSRALLRYFTLRYVTLPGSFTGVGGYEIHFALYLSVGVQKAHRVIQTETSGRYLQQTEERECETEIDR